MKKDDTSLKKYIEAVRPRFEDMLGQAVEIPSISMDPTYAKDIRRMAELAAQYLRELGAEATVIETSGYPVISGGWTTGNDHPTVTVYNHMDVQPAGEPEWRQAPFAFRKKNGLYHGRGATDDKGPALTALFAAKYAVEQGVPLNIRFLWELEEENGSPSFAGALSDRVHIPRPDSVVVSDTIWISKDQPAVAYGLRGLVGARLTLRTSEKDAHSGLTGGAARNPLTELAEVVHRCVDADTGRIKIPGFNDDVVRPTKAEMESFLASGFKVERFMKAYGFHVLRTKDAAEVLKRIWAMPTFEVHGFAGGYQGPGVKTVVPAYGEVKVSMRLVPNQTPDKAFRLLERFVRKCNPRIKVEREGRLEPFKGVFDGPYVEAVRKAVKAGFGKEPVFTREGGSIGAVVSMQRAWKVPIIFLGLSLPEHGYHAPNEYYDWRQASGGMKAFVRYFGEVAKIGK